MILKEYILNDLPSASADRPLFYFDIETTGLSHEKNHIVLIGAGFYTGNELIIKQYFAESTAEEKDILLSFFADIAAMNYCISFNGSTFDLPFIEKACRRNHIDCLIQRTEHTDLLHFLRPLKKTWSLESLRLKEVERRFGIQRQDGISGKESVFLYRAYVRTKKPAYLHTVLLHNYEDVFHLLLLHSKIREKLHQESLDLKLPNGRLKTFLHHFSLHKDRAEFHFINLDCDILLHYFYENGDELQIETKRCRWTIFLQKGCDADGKKIHYLLHQDRHLPLFIDGILVRDVLFFLLKDKINEIFV